MNPVERGAVNKGLIFRHEHAAHARPRRDRPTLSCGGLWALVFAARELFEARCPWSGFRIVGGLMRDTPVMKTLSDKTQEPG